MRLKLNVKQLMIASFVVFVIASLMTVLFAKVTTIPYAEASDFDITMMMRVWNYLGRVIYSVAFVYIFVRFLGEGGGISVGIQYGLAITLLIILPRMLWYINSTQFGLDYILTMTGIGILETLLCGIAAAMLYKPTQTKAT